MARFQIEPNLDGDDRMPGGGNVVHRCSVVLTADDLAALARQEPVKLGVALPNLTVRHLFLTVTPEAG